MLGKCWICLLGKLPRKHLEDFLLIRSCKSNHKRNPLMPYAKATSPQLLEQSNQGPLRSASGKTSSDEPQAAELATPSSENEMAHTLAPSWACRIHAEIFTHNDRPSEILMLSMPRVKAWKNRRRFLESGLLFTKKDALATAPQQHRLPLEWQYSSNLSRC